MNVDQNHMLSLIVKVSFSYSHFQKSREAKSLVLEVEVVQTQADKFNKLTQIY